MRKVLFLLVALLTTLSLQAQTIKKGNKFWDGQRLYIVQEVRMDKYVYNSRKERIKMQFSPCF